MTSDSPAVRRARGVIERLARDGSARAADGTIHSIFPVAISGSEGEALADWVGREAAIRTIETGLGYGISALCIAEALLRRGEPAARHVAMDPNQATRFGDCGLRVLAEAGLTEMVEFYPLASEVALPELLKMGRRFDFAFVDGNHRFDGVFLDLVYLGRLLLPSRVIFLDDYQLPAVAKAARFFVGNLGWTLEEVSTRNPQHHYAVVRTSAVPDERPFDYYVDF